jgi:hypothetical protein
MTDTQNRAWKTQRKHGNITTEKYVTLRKSNEERGGKQGGEMRGIVCL